MPKKGFKTISVIAEVSDYFFNEMLNVKDEYTIKKVLEFFQPMLLAA
jgi:hypothetical protein